jgi:anti-sigma-K factor RskA
VKTKVGSEFVALAVSVEPPGGSTTPTNVILVKNV